MGKFFFDKAARIHFVPDCSLALAVASKMEIALLVLLSLGVQCVIGNPLSEEKRWGHAASKSGASNGNNIVLGKKIEEEKRGGQAATNSQASNRNNIKIDPALLGKLGKRNAEEKRFWGGQAASNSNAANTNNIQIGKKEEEEKRGKGKGKGRGGKAATNSKVINKNKIKKK